MPNDSKPTPSDIVIMAAGAVMLVFSFLAFYKISVEGASKSWGAWSTQSDLFLFPLTTFVVLFAVIMAAQVAVSRFASGVNLPERVLGFTWTQIHLVLAAQCTLVMLTYLIRSRSVPTDVSASFDLGIGYWFMLIAAIALLVGAVLRTQEHAAGTGGTSHEPPAPPAG